MNRSTDRILTTHVGSLIRPAELQAFLRAKQAGEAYDEAAHAHTLKDTVAEVVRQQAECGIDVISDGEFGKAFSWSQYVIERLGVSSAGRSRAATRGRAAPTAAGSPSSTRSSTRTITLRPPWIPSWSGRSTTPARSCSRRTSTISSRRSEEVKVIEAFLPVAAPASVIPDRKNEYYKNDDDVLAAIGEAMHDEYKQIIDNGLLVQLDDARTAVTYDRMVPPGSLQDYLKWVARHVEILNDAIEGLPREKIRYHVCWGSWPGPHTTDVPLKTIST